MATVAGVFHNPLQANQAIVSLLELGIDRDDITLLMSDKTRDHFKSAGNDSHDRVAHGTTVGSVTGGVLGALLAGLTAVGGVAIPGAGLLVVGPLVAIATGVGAGAVAGGVVGLLISAGINQADAENFAAAIKAGKAVVLVHGLGDEDISSVRSILSEIASSTRAA
jgi:hypothetical protein